MEESLIKNKSFPMGNPNISEKQITQALEYLQNKRIEPNMIDQNGRTLLHSIALLNDSKIFEKFVSLGCNPIQTDKFGYQPFDYACDNCCYQVVDWLFQYNERIDTLTQDYTRDNQEIKESLENPNPAKKAFSHQSILRLHKICGMDYERFDNDLLQLVKVFVKWGSNLFEVDGTYYQGTPLQWATRANKRQGPNPLMDYLEEEMEKQLYNKW